jgi:hypothetical protein
MTVMPLSALAPDPSSGGSPPSTALSVSASLSFNGQPVYIATGNLLGAGGINLTFQLTNPVVVGDLVDFITWTSEQFGASMTEAQVLGVVQAIPLQWLQDALTSVLTATLTITILNVRIQPNVPSFAQVAASLAFNPPVGPSWLNLTQVGFMLTQGQSTTSP